METIVKRETEISSGIENWHVASEHFTADNVIDAYFKGKADGKDQNQNAYRALLLNNIKKTLPLWEKVYKILETKKIQAINSYLKIVSIEIFEVLILVSEDDFLDAKFLNVYDLVSDFEQGFNESSYTLSFSFTNMSEEFNENCLKSDGFVLKYESNFNL